MKNNYKNLDNIKGFTLIELMITVAIVGILAAVALPAYQDYVARSQVSEGLVLVSGAKPIIAEYHSNNGRYPTNAEIDFNGYLGKYIESTIIGADGKIIATFNNNANKNITGKTVTLVPEEDIITGNIKWNCASSVDSKFLPTSCNNQQIINKNSYSYDNFGDYTYKDGVLSMSGYSIEAYDIDENGIMYFHHEHPQAINDFKLHPDGTIERILSNPRNNEIIQIITSYPIDNDGFMFQNDIHQSYYTFIENGVSKKVLMATPYAGYNRDNPTGLELSNKYYDLSENAGNGYESFNRAIYNAQQSNDIQIYYDFVEQWKAKVDTIKANNGGKLPDDFPKSYLEFYNSSY